MHYKRIAALAGVALVAAAGLTACSNSTGSGDSSGTLTIAGLAAGDHAGIAAVGDLFTKQTGIKVNLTEDGSGNYPTTLRTQLGAGTAPDVFFTYPGNGQAAALVPLAKAGLLKDLTSLGFADKIPPAYTSAATYEGKPYVVPTGQGVIGAIYNQTAMDEGSYTVPETFSDVLALCASAQTAGKSAYAVGFTDDFVQQMISYALTATTVYGPSPDFAKDQADGKATFADSGWKKAFQEYVQMKDANCFENNFQGTSFNDSATMVAKGQALGLIGVNAFLAQLTGAAPSGTKFVVEPFPATDNASDTRIPAAFASSYAVNAKAKNMSAAMKFAKLLASPEGQKLYAEKSSGIPVFIPDGFKSDPALDPMLPYLSANKFSTYPDQGWPNASVAKAHATVVSEMLAGQLSVDDALKQMDDAYKQG